MDCSVQCPLYPNLAMVGSHSTCEVWPNLPRIFHIKHIPIQLCCFNVYSYKERR